eukprot:SAG31_NODE_15506_length_751_cov_1.397239_3_plen_100_part_01
MTKAYPESTTKPSFSWMQCLECSIAENSSVTNSEPAFVTDPNSIPVTVTDTVTDTVIDTETAGSSAGSTAGTNFVNATDTDTVTNTYDGSDTDISQPDTG